MKSDHEKLEKKVWTRPAITNLGSLNAVAGNSNLSQQGSSQVITRS